MHPSLTRGARRAALLTLALGAVAPAAAHATTLAETADGLLLTGTSGDDRVLLDDSYNPAGKLRFEVSVPFTSVPGSCVLREDTMADCAVGDGVRVRVELGGGNDTYGVLNRVSLPIGEVTVDGGDGSDRLHGDHVTARREVLLGGAGKDAIDGFGGDDEVRGGAGDDVIEGNAGNDRVLGEDGNDTVSGDDQAAPGADVIDGGAGNDLLKDYTEHGTDVHPAADVSLDGVANDGRAGEGDDVAGIERHIAYVNGTHVLTDGAEDWQVWSNVSSGGASKVLALGGDDKVVGEDAQETIDGGAGNDYLEGGKGHDTLVGGPGRDVLYGDDTDSSCNAAFPETCVRYGNDLIEARDGEQDTIDCGAGTDRVVADADDVVAPNCETVERARTGTGTGGGSGSGTSGGSPSSNAGPGRGTSTVATRRFALATPQRLGGALSKGLALRLTGATKGTRKITAKHGRTTVATATVKVPASGRATVRLRFTKAARKKLRRAKKVSLRISGAGLKTTVTLRR